MTGLPPLPPGAPAPPPERYTEPRTAIRPALRVILGLPLGLVAGLANGLLPLWVTLLLQQDLRWSRFWLPLVLLVAIGIVVVRRTWRSGMRAVPVGYCIGVPFGVAACVALWIKAGR